MVNKKVYEELGQYAPFENCDWEIRVKGTTDHDPRVMTFVDNLWGFEITGGTDQFEPLTVIAVKRSGLARRAGIRVNDVITQINDIDASKLTLRECQQIIAQGGRHLKIYVEGESDAEEDEENTADLWFKPLSEEERRLREWEKRMQQRRKELRDKWGQVFPWNDKNKKIYKESNCFMVESKVEENIKKVRQITLTAKSQERDNVSPNPEHSATLTI